MPTEPAPHTREHTILEALRFAASQETAEDVMQLDVTLREEHRGPISNRAVQHSIAKLRAMGHMIDKVVCYSLTEPREPRPPYTGPVKRGEVPCDERSAALAADKGAN